MEPTAESMHTQLRKGVVEYCVLASLQRQAAYGLELASLLHAKQLISSEGTLYPLLSRLRRQGLVETTWQESASGPPRRYYQLTDAGVAALGLFTTAWHPFSAAVTTFLGESS